jgi:hypothetical protein
VFGLHQLIALRDARYKVVLSQECRGIGESTLEADVECLAVLVDDDPHRDAAGRADRRPLVIRVGFALLLHAASLLDPTFGPTHQPSVDRSALGVLPWAMRY